MTPAPTTAILSLLAIVNLAALQCHVPRVDEELGDFNDRLVGEMGCALLADDRVRSGDIEVSGFDCARIDSLEDRVRAPDTQPQRVVVGNSGQLLKILRQHFRGECEIDETPL